MLFENHVMRNVLCMPVIRIHFSILVVIHLTVYHRSPLKFSRLTLPHLSSHHSTTQPTRAPRHLGLLHLLLPLPARPHKPQHHTLLLLRDHLLAGSHHLPCRRGGRHQRGHPIGLRCGELSAAVSWRLFFQSR